MKKELLRIITFLAGLYFFLEWVLPESLLESTGWRARHESISEGFVTVGVMALGLGLVNIFQSHGKKLVFLKPGWMNSFALILGLLVSMTLTFGNWVYATGPDSIITKLYTLMYDGFFVPLGSAMFALLGIYIGSAAYRAFRIKSLEAALMMVAAVLVMLGQITYGSMLYSDMPKIRQWLLEVPNSAAFRAIRLGTAVAALVIAIRMWLSIEPKKGNNA